MLQYHCVQKNLQNVKKFASEAFKRSRSGKIDVVEVPQNEGYVNKNIQ